MQHSRIFHVCSCGAGYDADAWARLRCPGVFDVESGYALELRDCPLCKSTMAVVLRPVTLSVHQYLEAIDREDDAA